MTGKLSPERKREATSTAPEEVRTQSYTRFTPRGQRGDRVTPESSTQPGAHAPSTLPPPPFEAETDVAGHEWWLEAHMHLASNLLCIDTSLSTTLSKSAAHRARAIADQIADVRDATYELYCDAADPRMAKPTSESTPLTKHIEQLYAWCDRVLDALVATRNGQIDREGLRAACAGVEHLFDESLRERIRAQIEAIDADFTSPVEPLRNLPKDLEQVFLSAMSLRDSIV
jgi:hypothetical protein